MRHGNILWAFFRLLELAMPLFFLFTGLGTRLRRMCEHISGGRWFWTVTLFACTHLALAALITLPFDFYFGYVQQHAAGKSNRTLPSWVTGEGVQLTVRLVVASLLIWLPYRLIARSPRRWCLYCALALIPFAFLALVVLPVWVAWAVGRSAAFPGAWGFSELRDPASLPLIVFMFAFLWLAILPFFNLFARHIELEADRFGLELTHQNHAAAMVCVRDAQSDLAPDWDTFFLIFEATHPSIATRIKFANSYKPWERGVPLVYGNVCKPE
jgi:hypothetical protein